MNRINIKTAISQIVSPLLAYIPFLVLLIMIGYSIEDVDATMYPPVATALILYIGVGELVLIGKGIDAPFSRRMLEGRLDLAWGIKHYYWVLWWPRFIGKR